MMKIFILIVVATLIFLACSAFLYPPVAAFILYLLGVHIADSRGFYAITNSLALLTSIVWVVWYYKHHISKKKESDVTESSGSSDKKSRVYDQVDLAMVARELKSGEKVESLWLQAKIDADKTGRDVEVIYTEYRLEREQQERDWNNLPNTAKTRIRRDQRNQEKEAQEKEAYWRKTEGRTDTIVGLTAFVAVIAIAVFAVKACSN